MSVILHEVPKYDAEKIRLSMIQAFEELNLHLKGSYLGLARKMGVRLLDIDCARMVQEHWNFGLLEVPTGPSADRGV